MFRRTLTLAAAAALATGALMTSTPAHADDLTCTDIDQTTLAGTWICTAYSTDVQVIWKTHTVVINGSCVDSICTPSRTEYVPLPSNVQGDVLDAWGEICYEDGKGVQRCTPFTDDMTIHIGDLIAGHDL